MDRVKVLAVVPYKEMGDIMESLVADRDDISLTVYFAPTEQGAELVRTTDTSRYDVIISRGGTAELISQVTDLPVISVPLSPYDIQDALIRVGDPGKHIAVVGFSSITTAADTLCDILNLDFETFTVNLTSQIPSILQELKHRGIEKILGDTASTMLAEDYGIEATLIASGTVSIEDALNKAVSYFSSKGRMRFANSLYLAELNARESLAVAMSADGRVLYSAPELTVSPAIRNALQHLLQDVMSNGSLDTVKAIGSREYEISALRIIVDNNSYAFFRLGCLGKKLPFTAPGVSFYDSAEDDLSFVRQYYGSPGGKAIADHVRRLADSGLPMLIQGPAGTGCDEMAGFVCMQNSLLGRSCIVIDCDKVDSHGWNRLFSDSGLIASRPGLTLVFRHCFSSLPGQYERLMDFLADSALRRHLRLIFTAEIGHDPRAEQDKRARFTNSIYGCYYTLPGLNERTADLPEIISSCLHSVCASFGSKTVSIAPEAIQLLTDFKWKNNLPQLRRLLTFLAAESFGSSNMITASAVSAALAKENASGSSVASESMDLSGTLEDITLRVVKQVLKEENMNRSSTARRLGISRATVWRILEKDEEKD